MRESTPVGSVIQTVTADDADTGLNGLVVYSLTDDTQRRQFEPSSGRFVVGGSSSFGIRAETGEIYVTRPLDCDVVAVGGGGGGRGGQDATTVVVLTVTANDLGADVSLSSIASVVVHIEDDNDNAPTSKKLTRFVIASNCFRCSVHSYFSSFNFIVFTSVGRQ